MTHLVKVSKEGTPVVYGAFLKVINFLSKKHNEHNFDKMLTLIYEEFDIKLKPYNSRYAYHEAYFPSEGDYLTFVLRWA